MFTPASTNPQAPAARRGWLAVLACLLAAGLQTLSAGWPGTPGAVGAGGVPEIAHATLEEGAWLLQLAGAALFYAALTAQRQPGLRHTALLAAVFGFAWQAGTTSWLFIGLHSYAGLSAPLSVLAVAALGGYLAMYTVVAALLFAISQRCQRRLLAQHPGGQAAASAAAFAAAWLLAELGRALVLTGFPWAASGYAHVQGPLRTLAPWLGVYGSAAVAAFVAALCVSLLRGRGQSGALRAVTAMGLAGLLAAMTWWPEADFTQSTGEFETSLLQGNVSQEGKFEAARVSQALDWHSQQLLRSQADLAMTPETAFPVLEQELPAGYWQRLHQRARSRPGVMLIGMPHRLGAHSQTNTLVGLGMGLGPAASLLDAPADGTYRYAKQHLVPFAEFTPPGFAWFTQRLNLPLPTFARGPVQQPPLRLQTRSGPVQVIAPLICFEDLYGEELAPRFRQPAQAPTAFANASNMAWFDDAPAMAQHLRIAQYRSLEFQRPTLRATNTGPTVVINHHGQVTRALAPHTTGVLHAVVEGRSGLTPYAGWVSRLGLWPLAVLAALVLVLPCLPWRVAAPGRRAP